MAFTKMTLTNGLDVKEVPLGYSWTMLLFGFWVCVFRSDWWWALAMFIAGVLTYGIAAVVCSFFYNKSYAKRLFDKGYYVHSLPSAYTEDHIKSHLGYLYLPRNPTQ